MNDGSVRGIQYFKCEPNHGLFVRPHAVQKMNEEIRMQFEARARDRSRQEPSQDLAHVHTHSRNEQFQYLSQMGQSHAQLQAQPGSVPLQTHAEHQHAQQSTPPRDMPPQEQRGEYPYSASRDQPYAAIHAYGEYANPQTQPPRDQHYRAFNGRGEYGNPQTQPSRDQPYGSLHRYRDYADQQTQPTRDQPYNALHRYEEYADPQTQHQNGPSDFHSQVRDNEDSGVKGKGFLYSDFY